MARADVIAALAKLQGNAGFREYVHTLQSECEDVMTKILLPENREIRDELCAEARVYREILLGIHHNTRS